MAGCWDERPAPTCPALDKEGQLVVIENKLDDTGRDVVWQALKYAAYVSSLTRTQIVDIFQAYLDRFCNPTSARRPGRTRSATATASRTIPWSS